MPPERCGGINPIKFFGIILFKIEDTPDGGVRITREICKSCKIGNKMIGSLMRNVQYGRGPRTRNMKKAISPIRNYDDIADTDYRKSSSSSNSGKDEIFEKSLENVSKVF